MNTVMNVSTIEFTSNKGGRKIAHAGYCYNFDGVLVDGQTTSWRCEKKNTCCAHVYTIGGEVVETLNEHSHPSDPARVKAKLALLDMKERAANTSETTSNVLRTSLANLPDCVLGVLPSAASLKKTIRGVRKEISKPPPVPTNLVELIIPAEYAIYKPTESTADKFLLADSGPGAERVLIFGRERNIREMRHSNSWWVDGTFSIAPSPFYQVFVVLAEVNGGVLPFLHILLPGKSGRLYENMFGMVKELDPNIDPKVINCDFELAIMNSARAVFPNVSIAGCYFHLASNVRKQVAALGLREACDNDPEMACHARMLVSLAFVPPDDVEYAFETLADVMPEELKDLANYFEDTYIGR